MTQANGLRSRADPRRRVRELQAQLEERDKAQNRHGWVKPAVLSSAITLIVAVIAVWGAWLTAQFGADEDREKESREKRSQIYADYLAAARTYSNDQALLNDIERLRQRLPTTALAPAQVQELVQAQSRKEASRTAYYKQVDLVYVYGSDEAWAAHEGVFGVVRAWEHSSSARPLDKLDAPLRRFQSVFCKEASATPRKGCGM